MDSMIEVNVVNSLLLPGETLGDADHLVGSHLLPHIIW